MNFPKNKALNCFYFVKEILKKINKIHFTIYFSEN